MASQVIVEGAAFGRNIILANFMGAENLGIAASIALGLRLLEMVSDVALDRFLLQAPDGDCPSLQSNAQGLNLIRGLFIGFVFAATGYPLAILVGKPDSAVIIAALGLVPLVRGAVHLDHKRLVRALNVRSAAIIESMASVSATAFAWPIAAYVSNFEAIVWVSLAQALALLVGSHLLAERAYRVAFDRATIGRLLRFGWPLIIGGLCVFGAIQGDRLIIALSCPMADLGRFTVAAQLALTPTFMGVRIASYVFLPVLSRAVMDNEEFKARYGFCLLLLAIAGLCLVVGFASLGSQLITAIYGQEFSVSPTVIALLSLAAALRLLRAAPTLARLAEGDSRSTMHVDLYRLGGLALAAMAGAMTGELAWIVAGACAGEFVALIAAGRILKACRELPIMLLLGPALTIAVAVIVAWMGAYDIVSPWLAVILLGAACAALSWRILCRTGGLRMVSLRLEFAKFRRAMSSGSPA